MDDPTPKKTILQALADLPVFSEFGAENLESMAALSNLERYAAGETIVQEGEWGHRIYFLVSGTVRVTKGQQDVMVLGRAGDLFGEVRVVEGDMEAACVQCVEDTTCLAMDVSRIDHLTPNDKIALGCVLYKVFAELLAHRLKYTERELIRVREETELLRQQLQESKQKAE